MLARFLLALGLAIACGSGCRAAIGAGELPSEFSLGTLGQRLRLNGLPLEVVVLATPLPPRRACSLIAERWSKARGAVSMGCRQSGEWLLISACIGSQELTVQLRQEATGSRGYLSKIDLRARPGSAPRPRVPMPSGARVRSVLQSSGPEGETAQFTIGVPLSPKMALLRMTEHARRFGWEVTSPPQPWAIGGTFDMRRRNELARGVLTREAGGSGLVLVETTVGSLRP
jgi:hypothetical protein